MHSSRSAFTLIELLVVIAIIAILAVVVVLTLNPAEMLRQSRDANRLSDMSTMGDALNLYVTDQGGAPGYSLGPASTTYLSILDPAATSTAGTNCSTMGLPGTSTGWSYHCPASSTFRTISTLGWIPVNLSILSSGSPLSSLPIDPTNQTSTNLYYAYYTNGSQYEVSSFIESQKYAKSGVLDGGNDPTLLQAGSGMTSLPDMGRGLVGYWNLDEGTGTVAIDLSGNGNNGALTCFGTSCSIPTWTSGKIGANALQFAGTAGSPGPGSAVAVNTGVPNLATLPQLTWTAWIYPTAVSNDQMFITNKNTNSDYFRINGSKLFLSLQITSSGQKTIGGTTALTNNQWYFVAARFDGNNMALYLNGSQDATMLVSSTIQTIDWGAGTMNIGAWVVGDVRPFNGLIDDVRGYNRALSPVEIQEMYNAGK